MKKNLKVLGMVIAILTTTMLVGCAKNEKEAQVRSDTADKMVEEIVEQANDKKESEEIEEKQEDGKTYTIGVIQPLEHAALDAAREGFIASLADGGYKEGENLTLDLQNAQGDTSNLSTISDRFVSKNVDMVLAIATDAAQSIAAKTEEIPIVATAVTSFSVAGLVESEDAPNTNVTGTSDMNPVAAQIGLLKELVPDMETVGLIYNSGEDNSVLQIEIAKAEIEALGLKYAESTVVNSNDIQTAMQSLVTKCEGVYIPTDNTLASAMASVHSVAMESKTPTVCGATSMVNDGGLAAMGINYYDLGVKAGKMAIEILEGADVKTMAVRYADSSDDIVINGTVAKEIGYEIPDKYKDFVIE